MPSLKPFLTLLLICNLTMILAGCTSKQEAPVWSAYDQSAEIEAAQKNPNKKLQFKLLQSKVLDKNRMWQTIAAQLGHFSESDYLRLKPLILERDIPTLQQQIRDGKFSYVQLTRWYLYRIMHYENRKDTYLNAIVAINPWAVDHARACDRSTDSTRHPIFGMPVLLKDNINAAGMPTTAGAYVFKDNRPGDAFIVQRIKENGGIILGKANLSEWANFLFNKGPNGFSCVGGQTLNPYGRKTIDSGGSSSGSAVAIAANYAAVAVGTETSGSILSPASKNSVCGIKPTIGLLSRSGIVPLSSTYDTPGPLGRTVTDCAILLSAMSGYDASDPAMQKGQAKVHLPKPDRKETLQGLRIGFNNAFAKDSLYRAAAELLKNAGAQLIEYTHPQVSTDGFANLLRADMAVDLPRYIKIWLSADFPYRTVADIVGFNEQDSLLRIPYGQDRFAAILDEKMTTDQMADTRIRLRKAGRTYFLQPMEQHLLEAVLSINNYQARYAAMASVPCLTVPMGYDKEGVPFNLTIIGKPYDEQKLIQIAATFEQLSAKRVLPQLFD